MWERYRRRSIAEHFAEMRLRQRMEIPLTPGKVAQIDPEAWPLVSHYTWNAKLENGGLSLVRRDVRH